MYSSYTAASFSREYELADQHGVNFEGALTWAFEFEDQPLFAGFRALASGGLDLPVLNVFRMFSRMSGQRLVVESDGAVPLAVMLKEGVRVSPDVSALASLDIPSDTISKRAASWNKLCILVWHYHDDDLLGPDADIQLSISGLPLGGGPVRLRQYRIDQDHSNSFTAWQRLGSPQQPTPAQYAQLEEAGQLAAIGAEETVAGKAAAATLRLKLPRQAVALLVLEWPATNQRARR
jgi:xylan 1,4-beta-xylosidase